MPRIPDNFNIVDLARNPALLRKVVRSVHQTAHVDVLTDAGIKRIETTPKSLTSILDLRSRLSAIPAFRPPPSAPTVLPTLELWLKADSLALNDGDSVATWPDSSTYLRDLTASSTARPIYKTGVISGKPAVLFDGVNDKLSNLTAGKDFAAVTVFLVLKQLATTTLQSVHGWGNAGGTNSSFASSFHDNTDKISLSVLPNSTVRAGGGVLPRENFQVFCQQWNGGAVSSLSSYATYDNGNAVSLSATAALTPNPLVGIHLGNCDALSFFGGYICEVMVYSEFLAAAAREEVEQYLFGKYGLAGVSAGDEPTEFENPDETAHEEETESESDINRILVSDTGEVVVSRTGNVLLSRTGE